MNTQTLLLNTSAGHLLIDVSTIVRIEAQSNYCKLWFSNGKTLVTAKLLRWFEAHLPAAGFARPHRSHLINRLYLQPLQPVNNSCLLRNGDCIQVSRRRKKELVKALLAA